PNYINETEASQKMKEINAEKFGNVTRTPEETKRYQLKRDLTDQARRGVDVSEEIRKGIDSGVLRPTDEKNIFKASKETALARSFKYFSLSDKIKVYESMNDSEREQVKDIMAKAARKLNTHSGIEISQLKPKLEKL